MKRYNAYEIRKIRQLRKQGLTYREICEQVGSVPKSTLTYICSGIELPSTYHDKLRNINREHLINVRQKALETNRNKVEAREYEAQARAARVVKHITADSIDNLKIALAMLYIGEGAKRASWRGLSLGSSSALILQTYIVLLEKCYGKKRGDMKARVQYRADQDITTLTAYWSKELGFSAEQFYKTAPDMRTVGKPTLKANYYGVCVVTCSGADIQLELSAIANEFAIKLWGYSSVD